MSDKSETSILKHVGAAVREARLKKGLSQKEVAEMVGKPKMAVSRLENGANSPDLDFLWAVCLALEVSIVNLFPGNEFNQNHPLDAAVRDLVGADCERQSALTNILSSINTLLNK